MFITLEGPDGSGKSSQIEPLAEFMREQGYRVVTTREPGGTEISTQIRNVLMNLKNKSMHPRTETLLFCAARAQHVEEFIRPHLERGDIVLCDRFSESTLAYQGYGHGSDLRLLRQILDFTTGGLWPDLILLLDIDAETGLKRRISGGGEWNRLDDYALALHKRVRQGYLEMAREDPRRWIVVDASPPPAEVQVALQRALLPHLPGI